MKWQIEHMIPAHGKIKAGEVLDRCLEEQLSHFPVVENGIFRGMIRCEDLQDVNPDADIKELNYLAENFFVTEFNDWTKLFSEFLTNETNILPVLDENAQYKGVIFLEDILMDLSEIQAFTQEGTLIRVQKDADDFSFFQAAQIVETNGGKLLGILLIEENSEGVIIELKVSEGDINQILQSFRRYDYKVLSEHEEDMHLQELREHAGFLNKYLEMGEE
jgi:CBS domain containing-hemolysin-like protein